MAKITNKTPEEQAAERQARLGIAPSGQKIAVPPAAPVAPVVPAEPAEAAAKKGKEQRLCIIVSKEQALKVKRYALENDTTVSDLLRGFIDSL